MDLAVVPWARWKELGEITCRALQSRCNSLQAEGLSPPPSIALAALARLELSSTEALLLVILLSVS